MRRLGECVRGEGTIYLAGGATAVLGGWRDMTVDIDVKADPEPPGFFEAVAELKEELDVNVELASPDQFIPPAAGWRDRSLFVGQFGRVTFYHYDPYGQALGKLQRRQERDWTDLAAYVRAGLVQKPRLWSLFEAIEPELIRYPGVDAREFRRAVAEFCHAG